MLRTLTFALCLGLALAAAPKAHQTKAVAPPKATHDDWVAPEFCNGVDCPKFTLLEANTEEVRLLCTCWILERFSFNNKKYLSCDVHTKGIEKVFKKIEFSKFSQFLPVPIIAWLVTDFALCICLYSAPICLWNFYPKDMFHHIDNKQDSYYI